MKRTLQAQREHRNLSGLRIRQARQKCTPPVSQDDLAGRLAARGISLDQTALSRIENRERYVMDYELVAIARCLKVSAAWLCGESRSIQ
jgi:hypothetical protein